MKLSELKSGDKAIIISVKASGPMLKRLHDMGMVRGEPVLLIRHAPLGDPIEIILKGYRLTIRKEEADNVIVSINPCPIMM